MPPERSSSEQFPFPSTRPNPRPNNNSSIRWSRPNRGGRQNTAASRSSRLTGRTTGTAETSSTRPNGQHYNLAGPPERPFRGDRHNTYIEEGYRALNPWMEESEQGNDNFSMASTFPRKVRFQRKPKQGDPKLVHTSPKGDAEPAPQIPAAQNQADSHRQAHDQELADAPEPNENGDPVKFSEYEAYTNDGREIGKVMDETVIRDEDKSALNTRPFNWWAIQRQRFRRPLAEWLGTTILMFIGICGNLAVATSNKQAGNAMTMYWAWGFAVMLAIYISGGSSGAFLSPSLTIMLSVFRGFPSRRIPIYILAQILGSFTGALLAFAIYRDAILHKDGALVPESTGVYIYTQPNTFVSPVTAFFSELLGTAVIGCSILALGDSGNSPPGAGMHAFVIGLLVTTATVTVGWNTKGVFNPVRDFGPRLAALAVGYPTSIWSAYHHWWLWGGWGATICGALFGGLVYDVCIFQGGESPVNYSRERLKSEVKRSEGGILRRLGLKGKAEDAVRQAEEGEGGSPEKRAERELEEGRGWKMGGVQ